MRYNKNMNDALTRAELLERCKAAGLKASAWKKERMVEELAKLREPSEPSEQPSEPAPTTEPEAGSTNESRNATMVLAPYRSGWCHAAPMWSIQHEACKSDRCQCPCHADDWARPPVPKGATLSKFNPARQSAESPAV